MIRRRFRDSSDTMKKGCKQGVSKGKKKQEEMKK